MPTHVKQMMHSLQLVHVLFYSYTTKKGERTLHHRFYSGIHRSTRNVHIYMLHISISNPPFRYAAPYPANPPSRGDGLSGMPSSTSGA